MVLPKVGRAARGMAYFALTCLMAALLLMVRFRRPAIIAVELTPGASGLQEAQDASLEAVTVPPEGNQAEETLGLIGALEGTAEGGDQTIFVHVAGCVAKPGLYGLRQGARVNDALDAAGGMTSSADSDSVNIALPVKDGQQVYIPMKAAKPEALKEESAKAQQETRQEVSEAYQPSPSMPPAQRLDVTMVAPDDGTSSGGATGLPKVDINAAGIAELDTLPGIGPSTAAKIVEYRSSNGPFSSIEQLMEVSGIGPAKFEAIREMVVAGR